MKQMNVYLAGPIFTERDRNFNSYLEQQILKVCPNMNLYLAQNNNNINDKIGCATSADIYAGDVKRLKEADMVITIMSGDLPPIGSSYESAYYCGLCENDPTKTIIALYDDSREGFHTYSKAKRDAMVNNIAENQWSYINLLAVGYIKKFGDICFTSEEFINKIIEKYNIFMNESEAGIYKITNLKNDLVYIGQSKHIYRRLLQHKRDYHTKNNPLYQDMCDLGIEYFKFEIIEKCNEDELDDKEKFWISYYDTYNYGYNQNTGGSGNKIKGDFQSQQTVPVYSYNLDGSFCKQYVSIAAAMRDLHLKSNDITRCIAFNDNHHLTGNKMWRYLKFDSIEPYEKPHFGKTIFCYDMKTRLFITSYANSSEAGKILTGKRQPHINDVANGKRKSCCGYLWSYNYYDKLPENYWLDNIDEPHIGLNAEISTVNKAIEQLIKDSKIQVTMNLNKKEYPKVIEKYNDKGELI